MLPILTMHCSLEQKQEKIQLTADVSTTLQDRDSPDSPWEPGEEEGTVCLKSAAAACGLCSQAGGEAFH